MARDIEVVIVDTAGRLQTSHDLMAELAKIRRVITRQLPEQPRHVLLVLDATTGQNGLSQAEAFLADTGVTGSCSPSSTAPRRAGSRWPSPIATASRSCSPGTARTSSAWRRSIPTRTLTGSLPD